MCNTWVLLYFVCQGCGKPQEADVSLTHVFLLPQKHLYERKHTHWQIDTQEAKRRRARSYMVCPKSIYKIFKKEHIDTELLLKISIILDYNFFLHYYIFFDYPKSTIIKEDVPIGELIRKRLKKEEREITWFARKLSYEPANIYKIFQKQHFDTELLLEISILLNYNFFIHYSDLFNTYKNSKLSI